MTAPLVVLLVLTVLAPADRVLDELYQRQSRATDRDTVWLAE